MNPIRPKNERLRLDPVSYANRRQQVLRRDGWRCQSCGAMTNLEVHHQKFRSRSGGDSEQNLITLCSDCHTAIHRSHANSQNAAAVKPRPGNKQESLESLTPDRLILNE